MTSSKFVAAVALPENRDDHRESAVLETHRGKKKEGADSIMGESVEEGAFEHRRVPWHVAQADLAA